MGAVAAREPWREVIVGQRRGLTGVDASLVRRLVADQFPQWANLRVRPVEKDGHDNSTFHLGDEMSVRMPVRHPDADHLAFECEWLPRLALHLPLPIPVPVVMGAPGLGYGFRWLVNRWIPGQSSSPGLIADLSEFAKDLAAFLNALMSIDATGAPAPGRNTHFRGCDLYFYDADFRRCLGKLGDRIDSRTATAIWEAALDAKSDRAPVWFHGDVAPDNLLVDDAGRLCGVIDFGQMAAGDPACDVTIAWTLFTGSSREVFRSELAVDEATWVRGRGWGIWKAMILMDQHAALAGVADPECIARDILTEA